MSIAGLLQDLRQGFTRTFWVANTLELFERLAFYGAKAVLAVYLAEKIGLGPQTGASLVGLFSGVLYSLPIIAGTFVDRYGYRKSLAACFSLFTLGYLLIGLAGMNAAQGFVNTVGKTPYVLSVLLLTAIGGSLIKPCIVGTVASTSKEKTRSLGYSIYYTLVNLGGAMGPLLALQVREGLGIEYVLLMSSITSFGILIGTLLFFDEPVARNTTGGGRTLAQVFRDMTMVFRNGKFILFLVIASGFYIMFWQTYYSLPFYAREILHFEKFELLETVDAWGIILLTIPATALVKRWRPITAVSIGLGVASLSWLLIPLSPTVTMTVIAVGTFAVGEAILAPRFYEYVASLAPQEQVGTYMGFAFLPVAIGSFVAGPLAGWLVANYIKDSRDPNMVWYILSGVGLFCTIAMVVYNQILQSGARKEIPAL